MEKINKYKGYLIFAVVFIVSLLSIIIQTIQRNSNFKVDGKEIISQNGKIAIYITGAVKNPGVYYVDENSRLANVLDICGGVNENADVDKLNLARKLVDSDKITVPIIQEQIEQDTDDDSSIKEENGKININTATKEELKTLNGIGDTTANKIIEYRKKEEFTQIEDIMNVSGFGQAKFNNIKDSICVN